MPYLSGFQLAITRLVREAKPLPRQAFGWSSGHHRAFVYPESWSTAACFDVAYQVDTLVTDAITVTIEGVLGRPTYGPRPPRNEKPFDDLLDSRLTVGASSKPTLKTVLLKRFLQPIVAKLVEIEKGREIGAETPMSVILYGPPGTSKTTYADRMSQFLGWPLLTIDPSHLLGSGVDNIHLEINRLFRMLEKAERVVVFFDEIDELVRDRDDSVEALSRFLTTSMLPRIVSLRRSRRLVFIVATNHIEAFDPAIARPGRFDLVLPVLPPSTEAKLQWWKPLATRLRRLGLIDAAEVREELEMLTFDETEALIGQTTRARRAEDFRTTLDKAAAAGVLRQPVTHGKKKTWADLMEEEESRMREGGALSA